LKGTDNVSLESLRLNILESVLITGGAGFLGRHLASLLARLGIRVTVIDNLSCSNSTFDCPELTHPRIECIQGSVFDRKFITQLIDGHKTVIHLASVVGVEETISRPFDTVENILGTLNLVKALTREHIVMFTSSADVYGIHSHYYDRPMREDDFFLFENARINRWVYPHVKALEENLIANSDARSVVIRVFNTYGPSMDFPDPKRVIPHFIDRILAKQPLRLSGNGSQMRCFCYVDDMICGMAQALGYTAMQEPGFTGCFNLGSSLPVTIRDLAEQIVGLSMELELIDRPLPILSDAFRYTQGFDDTWNRIPDINRARDEFGFQPQVSMADGLARTLTFYRQLQARSTSQALRATQRASS
jgi:UDP-glucose 4-epimerase